MAESHEGEYNVAGLLHPQEAESVEEVGWDYKTSGPASSDFLQRGSAS